MTTRSLINESSTYLPNEKDRRQLLDIKNVLTEYANENFENDFNTITEAQDFPIATIRIPGQEPKPLTPELADVLVKVADQLLRGKAVMVVPYNTAHHL